jgi:uncharacterized phiE125 gp8 family phage protein
MTEPITLAEAKAHLRVVISDEDDYISALIPAARQMVEGRTQRKLVPGDAVLPLSAFTDGVPLPGAPFGEITSITYIDPDGAAQTLSTDVYEANAFVEPATLERKYGQVWPAVQPGSIRVNFTAGYPTPSDVPQALKQWMLLAIGVMYENREQATAMGAGGIYELPESFMGLLWQPFMVYL